MSESVYGHTQARVSHPAGMERGLGVGLGLGLGVGFGVGVGLGLGLGLGLRLGLSYIRHSVFINLASTLTHPTLYYPKH